jgi:hypothetical protein
VAFNLPLPDALRKARWKVKIRDKETREPPHVTILRGTGAWRINLRTGAFMDAEPDPTRLPNELITFVRSEKVWKRLCDEWDRMYPANRVTGNPDEE